MPGTLRLDTTVEPSGAAVLHVRGEVDLATADRLRERLLAEVHRHERLTVDVSGAMFFDAAGLRALAAAHREAARLNNRPPALRGVRPLLAKALRVTGMHSLFPREQVRPA